MSEFVLVLIIGQFKHGLSVVVERFPTYEACAAVGRAADKSTRYPVSWSCTGFVKP